VSLKTNLLHTPCFDCVSLAELSSGWRKNKSTQPTHVTPMHRRFAEPNKYFKQNLEIFVSVENEIPVTNVYIGWIQVLFQNNDFFFTIKTQIGFGIERGNIFQNRLALQTASIFSSNLSSNMMFFCGSRSCVTTASSH